MVRLPGTPTTGRRPPARKLLSLFSGAGGLDIGLEAAGFETVLANELEPHACETLRQNQILPTLDDAAFDSWLIEQLRQRCYADAPERDVAALRARLQERKKGAAPLSNAVICEGDIRGFTSEEFARRAHVRPGQLTLVAGGAPCQPFSRAGKRETFDASDGRLFLEFVRVVRDLRPRWFLFENVKGLVQTKTEVWDVTCKDCGHRTLLPFELREAAEAGAALKLNCKCGSSRAAVRSRTSPGGSLEIIFAEFERAGYACTWKLLNAADFGAPQRRERVFIVGSRDGEAFEWPTATHGDAANGDQMTLYDGPSLRPWVTMADALWADGHPEFGDLNERRAVLWVKNVVRPHDEPVTWHIRQPSPTVGAHQAAKFALAPNGVPEAQLRRQQWHVLGKRQGDHPPVPVQHAYLSDRELLRLQTFPTSWYLFGTRMQRAFQIGNAVPTVLARAIGSAIVRACGDKAPAAEPEASRT